MTPMSTRTAWLIGAGSLLVAVAALAGLVALVPSNDAARLVVYVETGPSVQGPNDAGHTLPQVGADLVAEPPDYELVVGADDSVHSATLLAEEGDTHAYAVLSANDQVYLSIVDTVAGMASGMSVSWDDFESSGISLADDGITVTWRADGVVTWTE